MCKNKIWEKLLGVVLSGVLIAGMGMTALAACPPAPTCKCDSCECDAKGGRCVIWYGYSECDGAYKTQYCDGSEEFEYVNSEDESSPEEKVSVEIDMEISRQVDQAVAAAVAAGQAKDDAKAAAVVKLNSKYLHGTNGFSVYKMQDFQRANVDIDFEYDYDGNHYSIHMPAGQIPIDEDVPVYGPLYLAKIFSEGLTVTPIVEEAE